MTCGLLLIVSSTFLLSISAATNWNDFRVNWPTFTHLPQTLDQAQSQGWVTDDLYKQCAIGSTPGFRFFLPANDNPLSLFLLYNMQGHISGIQAASKTMPPAATISPNGPWIQDEADYTTVYTLTMYFRDPSTLCGNDSGSQIGDGLWFVTDGINATVIPQAERDLPLGAGTWGKGKCLSTMGNHYWYNINVNSDCDTLVPLFLLYNGGHLNGFGWALAWGNSQPGDRWEHPTSAELPLLFASDQLAECFGDSGRNFSTMHFYLSNPNLDDC